MPAARSHTLVSAKVNRLLEEAKALSLTEREQVIELLKAQPMPGEAQSKEDQLAELLLRRGLARNIRRKPTAADIARFRAWKPVVLEGRPVSESLIEERR